MVKTRVRPFPRNQIRRNYVIFRLRKPLADGKYILSFFADSVADLESISHGQKFVTKNGTDYGVPQAGSTVIVTSPNSGKTTYVMDAEGVWVVTEDISYSAVVANPSDAATAKLEKLKVNDTTYANWTQEEIKEIANTNIDDNKVAIDSTYSSSKITTELDKKQDTLISGTNIKTINGASILGSGNIEAGGKLYFHKLTLETLSGASEKYELNLCFYATFATKITITNIDTFSNKIPFAVSYKVDSSYMYSFDGIVRRISRTPGNSTITISYPGADATSIYDYNNDYVTEV